MNLNKIRARFLIKKIFILIGLPRSGKSTIREMILDKHFYIVPVSADDLRYEIYNQRYWENGESDVWNFRKHHLNSLMKNGTTILIDETNTTIKRRAPLLKLCDEFGYTPIYIHIDTDKEICVERAKKINDTYIIPTIERMSEQFEMPTFEEIEKYPFSIIKCLENNNYDKFDFTIFEPEFRTEIPEEEIKKLEAKYK